jgi:hypothetical protein
MCDITYKNCVKSGSDALPGVPGESEVCGLSVVCVCVCARARVCVIVMNRDCDYDHYYI